MKLLLILIACTETEIQISMQKHACSGYYVYTLLSDQVTYIFTHTYIMNIYLPIELSSSFESLLFCTCNDLVGESICNLIHITMKAF